MNDSVNKLHERSGGAEVAIARAIDEATRLNFQVKSRAFGNLLETTEYRLSDGSGNAFLGRGKGFGRQAHASGIFEALEHYYYDNDPALHAGPKVPFDFHGMDRPLLDGSPHFRLFNLPEDVPITRLLFRQMTEPHSELHYPAFLTNPRFTSGHVAEEKLLRRTRLRRYSTNSGTASGVTVDEALLHSLLEIIERDALSLLLIESTLSNRPRPVRKVARATLPTAVERVAKMAEMEARTELTIWEMTTDTGVPSFVARLASNESPHEVFFGYGASLDVDYAIERSILEAVQSTHICRHLIPRSPLSTKLLSGRITNYQRCLMEYGLFQFRGGEIEVSYENLASCVPNATSMSMKEQIGVLLGALEAQNVRVFSRILANNGISVAQVISPQLERFFLVSCGVLVAPGFRGHRVLHALGWGPAHS
jgi:ribosomal protein S12 methylthiotransferase accessory factor